MASQLSTAPTSQPAETEGYIAWSRDPAVGLLVVLPLWLCYEGARWMVNPDLANGAEALMELLPPTAMNLLSIVFLALVLTAAWSILRRDIPWARVGMVMMLEGTVYGLMLGPIAGLLTSSALPVLNLMPTATELTANLIGALGAGIFEELVFRLGLLSVFAWFFVRAVSGFGLPPGVGVSLAVVVSALLFSLFHHLGQDLNALSPSVFLFRTMAGILLGVLFVLRGIGVCIYTHAMYDVHYYLVEQP